MITNKMGKFSEDAQKNEELAKQKELVEFEKGKLLKIGDRCETIVPKQARRRGCIQYIGNFILTII